MDFYAFWYRMSLFKSCLHEIYGMSVRSLEPRQHSKIASVSHFAPSSPGFLDMKICQKRYEISCEKLKCIWYYWQQNLHANPSTDPLQCQTAMTRYTGE